MKYLCADEEGIDSIRETLRTLPVSVKEMYQRLLAESQQSASIRSRRIALATLSLLSTSQVVLGWNFLRPALAAALRCERTLEPRDVLLACKNLVVYEDDIFSFSHFSAAEFMDQQQLFSAAEWTISTLRNMSRSAKSLNHINCNWLHVTASSLSYVYVYCCRYRRSPERLFSRIVNLIHGPHAALKPLTNTWCCTGHIIAESLIWLTAKLRTQ